MFQIILLWLSDYLKGIKSTLQLFDFLVSSIVLNVKLFHYPKIKYQFYNLFYFLNNFLNYVLVFDPSENCFTEK